MNNDRTRREEKDELKKYSIFNIQYSILFLVLSLLAIYGFITVFAPRPYEPPLEPFADYDRAGMLEAVSPSNVGARVDEITALGNRFLGKPGFYAAEAMIRAHYAEAGLQVFEHEIHTVAPRTTAAAARDSAGNGVTFGVYPFMPNFYQPVATPDAGTTAVLLEVNDEVLRTRPSFEGCFALIDAAEPAPIGYGYDYARYAQLGFEGVVVSHRDGLDAIRWSEVSGMSMVSPVNFLRVAADPGVFDYAGRSVRFRVTVRYKNVPNRTIVGILKGASTNREALVIPCSYDALSMLPDRSPGVIQAGAVAAQLQLLDGLLPHRDALRRDVVFVAFGGRVMAHDAQDRLVSVIGSVVDRDARRAALKMQQADNNRRLDTITACFPVIAALSDPQAAELVPAALAELDDTARSFFSEQLQYVLNTLVFERSETALETKIAFEKGDSADISRPEFAEYHAARKSYDKAFSCAGLRLPRLLTDQATFVTEVNLRRRMVDRLTELRAHHEANRFFLEQSLAINSAFSAYDRLVVIAPELIPAETANDAQEELTFTMGRQIDHSSGEQPARQALHAAIQELGLEGRVSLRYAASMSYGQVVASALSGQDTEAAAWAFAGHPAYSVVSHGRSHEAFAYPSEQAWMRNFDSLSNSLQVVGAAVLSVAYGNGEFKSLKFNSALARTYRGNVFVSNVGQSIIPNYPLAGALVGCTPIWGLPRPGSGYCGQLFLMSDVYGRYERQYCFAPFPENIYDYSPQVVGFDARGQINMIKDTGAKAQRIYGSVHLGPESLGNDVNLVCFRAAPVTLLDLINPQSMKSYAGADFVRVRGLNTFDSSYTFGFSWEDGVMTTFIKPDEYFFVELKAGAADNELVQTTRAFLLGPTPPEEIGDSSIARAARPGSEIRGRGYLAAETPLIRNVAREAARSMVMVNGQRLRVQDHFGMADEQTREFQDRAESKLEAAGEPGAPRRITLLRARDAVTYATLNHPVLRRNVFEAVAGILWYLGLLVPFTFFFEKLVFGFPDIRKQLGAHVVIFLTVFGLLKLLHPAFAMIRSSLMILLGFVILLISSGILVMFSSRFRENMESIRQQRGQVTAAEVNKVGAIVTAFMLGLNNMHRRRVRTMLTCGTLVLITFVMICFTSVQSDIVDSSIAIGKAPFSGLVVKNEEFRPVAESELFALRTKYGDRYSVAARSALIGLEDWETKERQYPQIRLVRRDGGTVRDARPRSILILSPDEPLADHLPVRGRWFVPADETDLEEPAPVLVPAEMAERLGISVDTVEAGGEVTVEINGQSFPVCGVFDGAALNGLLDLDGQNLLPFDIRALRELKRLDYLTILATDDDPRLSGNDVILVPRALNVQIPMSQARILSVAVAFPESLSPREAREEVGQYMEQSGRLTHFGLDGFAFLGKRARESTFVGLVDMLIPLIIAAITVLNTIRGSVYERKDEIFVYNAVGIAPRHIFFMFFAEAFVYAVVGSVLGYILSQATGRVLTALNLTGGLNMTFTSLGTIYASLTIAASVFVSTWFPARTAMMIASPSTDLGWRLPEPEGNSLRFRLPFTFDWRDRIAVLAFFHRYFVDHGEGSSGRFFAGLTRIGISGETDPLNNDGYIPTISAPIWLKPFDLGVSQDLRISLPTDPETGEFVAEITLTRLSGTLENWKRLNRVFVGLLREHFLHWRAVKPEERAAMFEEAREELNIEYYSRGCATEAEELTSIFAASRRTSQKRNN